MKTENKALNILVKIGKAILTTVLVLMLIVVLVQQLSRNDLSFGGIRVFSIVSASMSPEYKIGDILISQDIPADEIQIGDDLTYKGTEGEMQGLVITHRVIEIWEDETDNKIHFRTQGIASDFADPEITEDNVYGKVIYKTAVFSFLGRLMDNMIIYYVAFVIIGVSVSFQIINVFIKRNDKDDKDEKDESMGSDKEGN